MTDDKVQCIYCEKGVCTAKTVICPSKRNPKSRLFGDTPGNSDQRVKCAEYKGEGK